MHNLQGRLPSFTTILLTIIIAVMVDLAILVCSHESLRHQPHQLSPADHQFYPHSPITRSSRMSRGRCRRYGSLLGCFWIIGEPHHLLCLLQDIFGSHKKARGGKSCCHGARQLLIGEGSPPSRHRREKWNLNYFLNNPVRFCTIVHPLGQKRMSIITCRKGNSRRSSKGEGWNVHSHMSLRSDPIPWTAANVAWSCKASWTHSRPMTTAPPGQETDQELPPSRAILNQSMGGCGIEQRGPRSTQPTSLKKWMNERYRPPITSSPF